jgi:S-DNA-T family DNA segregation ATPase FtsK/SpoIIIE
MPPRKAPKKRPAKGRSKSRAKRSSFSWPRMPRMRQLEQHELDLVGLGLVILAAFFATIFYLGWDGGKVGEALAQGLIFMFGGVAYLTPVALFGTGAVLVLRPVLPSVRPFRAGAICVLLALMLGLAAGSFGLGPNEPQRSGFFEPAYFREHGGVAGEAMYWSAKTLFSTFGAHLIFTFLMLAGLMLLTGASIAGIINSTRESVSQTTRRVRRSTTEFAAVVTKSSRTPAPDEEWDARPPEVEPVVRATHVEAPALDAGDDDEQAYSEEPVFEPLMDEEPEFEPVEEEPPVAQLQYSDEDLTPMGKLRSSVTEGDGFVYKPPSPSLLKRSSKAVKIDTRAQERTAAGLVEALSHFGVNAQVVGTVAGPHVTRYELKLAPGIKMSKIATLKDDLAYALAATDVRILAPIPGKQAVGVEVPNLDRRMVHLGDVYQEAPAGWSPLTVWLGKDIAGKAIGTDLAKQPHILVAGTTGSGKSGCVNAMLSSILLHASPNEVKLVLVDPKQVELNHYESIPHLITPVVTSPRLAANVLNNLIKEMEERYGIMSRSRTRNLVELNRQRERDGERPLPYILCVIDELADLMMVAPGEVEDAIIRLAQKPPSGRARTSSPA